ncbi:MAG: hypothetical protein A4E19_13605 [Nitrospira sp. SG-bin1]|nr:MAG: hypothetical protein A4E19_13605 [Nitrospira sp. SG-bin1]
MEQNLRALQEGAVGPSVANVCTSVVTTEAAFLSLRDEWDELLDQSEQSVFFLRWHWNYTWWRYLAPHDSHLFLITCRETDGRLIGLAPLYWHRHRVSGITYLNEILFLGTGAVIKTSEYLDIIALRRYENQVAQAVARFLRQQPGWDRLWLWGSRSESSMLWHFRDKLGAGTRLTSCDRSHYRTLHGDWQSTQASLGKSIRTNISYYTRRLFKTHECIFRSVDSLEEFGPAMEAFITLHQARWQSRGKPGSFMQSRFKDFLTNVMQESIRENCLRFWVLEIDKKISAVLVGFLHEGILHYFQGGFDPTYAKDSIGTVMLGLCMRSCIEEKEVREFDFMGGESSYKKHWTRATREIIELEAFQPGFRSCFYNTVKRLKDVAAPAYRELVPSRIRMAVRSTLGAE